MRVVFGSDHGGYELKNVLIDFIKERGFETIDAGCLTNDSVDYPDYAAKACAVLKRGEAERAVLVCGTGIGMCISANKLKGIRCALCSDATSARLTREHNDTNALALGGRIIGVELAKDILATWLDTSFSGSYHERRVKKIMELENQGE